MSIKEKFKIFINGKEICIYDARVSRFPFNRHWPGHQRTLDQTLESGFITFDVAEKTAVKIECGFDFEEAVVKPLSFNITPERNGNCITFTLNTPQHMVVEFVGTKEVLHIFANPEEVKPSLSDTDLYFGPGEHNVGRIVPKNGQTIYIDEGAVVYGEIYAVDAENVTVAGRGILDHSKFEPEINVDEINIDPLRPSPIVFRYSKNIVIKDIIVRDPCFLAVRPIACEDVTIDNIKIIGCWRYNSDGIDLINTRRATVSNCFIRSFDDSICLKGFYFTNQGEMFHNRKTYDTMEDIIIENCVVWNDWGKALHIGVDLCAKEVRNCVFRNCDVIHATHSALDVSNVDYAEVYDILFDDIRVEYDKISQSPEIQKTENEKYVIDTESPHMPRMFTVTIEKTIYSHGGTKRGKAKNISFKDIKITAPKMPPCRILGYDDEYSVDGVHFENITLNGVPFTSFDELGAVTNEYAKNITLK